MNNDTIVDGRPYSIKICGHINLCDNESGKLYLLGRHCFLDCEVDFEMSKIVGRSVLAMGRTLVDMGRGGLSLS